MQPVDWGQDASVGVEGKEGVMRVIGGVHIDALGTGSDDEVGGVGELLTVVMPRWCWACRRGLVRVWSFVTMYCLMWT